MIYASIGARRLNRDPAPWVQADGTRTHTPGDYPIGQHPDYRPRPEYTPAQTLGVNPILDYARDSWDDADPWGSALAYLFPVCALADYLGDAVPGELGYRPSFAGAEADLTDGSYESVAVLQAVGLLGRDSVIGPDDDGPVYIAGVGEVLGEDLDRASAYVDHAMRVLNRIADMARAAGLDY